MVTCLRIPILYCILICAAAQLVAADMEDGIARITTCKGKVVFTSSEGKKRDAVLHSAETLSGIDVVSGKGDHIFLALSNGTALGIYENSRVRIESFEQLPFLPSKESIDYEPSRSKLVLELFEGSLSFTAEHISPLSEFIIKLPQGRIKVHAASGRVLYDENGAKISISEGIVSYFSPKPDAEEEFINSPNVVLISDRDAALGRKVATPLTESEAAKQLTDLLVKATHRANQRVIFKVLSEEASIPQPVLIARPETLQQPSPRPYRYLD